MLATSNRKHSLGLNCGSIITHSVLILCNSKVSYRDKTGKRSERTESYTSHQETEIIKKQIEFGLMNRSSIKDLVSRRILKFGDEVQVVTVEGKDEYERR